MPAPQTPMLPSTPQGVPIAGGSLGISQPPQAPAPFDFDKTVSSLFDQGYDKNIILDELAKNEEFVNMAKSRNWGTPDILQRIDSVGQLRENRLSQLDASWAQGSRNAAKIPGIASRIGMAGVTGAPAGPGGVALGVGTQAALEFMPGLSNFTSTADQPLGSPADVSQATNMGLELVKQALGTKIPFLRNNPGVAQAGQGLLSWLAGEGAKYQQQGAGSSPAMATMELAAQSGLPGLLGHLGGRGNKAFREGDVQKIVGGMNKYESMLEPFEKEREVFGSLTDDYQNLARNEADALKKINIAEASQTNWLGQVRKRGENAAGPLRSRQRLTAAKSELAAVEREIQKTKARGGLNASGKFVSLPKLEERRRQLSLELDVSGMLDKPGNKKVLEYFDTAINLYGEAVKSLQNLKKNTNFSSAKMSPEGRQTFRAIADHPKGRDALMLYTDELIDAAFNTKGQLKLSDESLLNIKGLTELLGERPEIKKAIQSKLAKKVLNTFANSELEQGQQLVRRISSLGAEGAEALFGNPKALGELQDLGGAIKEMTKLEKQAIYAGVGSTLRPYISHISTMNPTGLLNRHIGKFDSAGHMIKSEGFAKALYTLVTSSALKQTKPALLGERIASIFKNAGVPLPPEQSEEGR